jgi:hypothetical protein
MKHPISWHKGCLANTKRTLEERRLYINEQIGHLHGLEMSAEFYQAQILRAEQQGKDGFDADKFMVKK